MTPINTYIGRISTCHAPSDCPNSRSPFSSGFSFALIFRRFWIVLNNLSPFVDCLANALLIVVPNFPVIICLGICRHVAEWAKSGDGERVGCDNAFNIRGSPYVHTRKLWGFSEIADYYLNSGYVSHLERSSSSNIPSSTFNSPTHIHTHRLPGPLRSLTNA